MQELVVETNGAIATMTLNRPERRNALSKKLMEAILDACQRMRDDTAIRIVVFEAAGDDFSVGVDLTDPDIRSMAQMPVGQRRRALWLGPDMVRAIQELPQTTIVAMQGYCLGGGGCIALACDLRVAASTLAFGMPEVLRGMTMTWRTVPLMVAHFGPARTKELLLTGKFVGPAEAITWGLANRVVEGTAAEAHAEAARWAAELAEAVPPVTASMVKQTVNAVANAHTSMVHMDTDQYILSQQTDDFREAVTAFLEKRKPRFEGR